VFEVMSDENKGFERFLSNFISMEYSLLNIEHIRKLRKKVKSRHNNIGVQNSEYRTENFIHE
jgi:hypothetical protein